MQTKKLLFPIVAFLVGMSAFCYIDFVYSSQVGTLRKYNPMTDNREQITSSTVEEVVHYGWSDGQFFDFFSDASFQRFLDDDHPFSTQNYKPDDLVAIDSHFTSNQSSHFSLRSEAAVQFADMARAFSNAFNFKSHLSLTSAYRSPAFQKKLATNCSSTHCADPGASEHEAGLAVDIGVNGGSILSSGGKYYQWLYDNAHLYGFHNTYQKGVEIDGKMVEPRHRRYVGIELATYLHDTNQTFAEYFYNIYPKS